MLHQSWKGQGCQASCFSGYNDGALDFPPEMLHHAIALNFWWQKWSSSGHQVVIKLSSSCHRVFIKFLNMRQDVCIKIGHM